ncbi:MAG: hypothetical protein WB421_17435, partial [Terriglobales bacterium]
MLHYVDVTINRDGYFVNYYSSLCRFVVGREGRMARERGLVRPFRAWGGMGDATQAVGLGWG